MRVQDLIGRNVREAREVRGLSQRELGERLGQILGKPPWHPQAVSAAERGEREWTASDLAAAAVALNRDISWFFQAPEGVDHFERLDLGGEEVVHVGRLATTMTGRSVEGLADQLKISVDELLKALREEKRDES